MAKNFSRRIAIIVVNYFSSKELRAYVEAVRAEDAIHLYIVNNGDTEDGLESIGGLQCCKDGIFFLDAKANLGYFGGAQFALDYLVGNNILGNYEWIIVSNADIAVNASSLVKGLRNVQGKYLTSNVMWVAPRITSKLSGRNQNPYLIRRPPRLKYYLLAAIFYFYPLAVAHRLLSVVKNKVIAHAGDRGDSAENTKEIYAGHGSFIAVSASYFEAGGNFRSEAFLFCEENYLAEHIVRLGGKVVYDEGIEVVHVEHITTGIVPNRKMVKFLADAHFICASRYMN